MHQVDTKKRRATALRILAYGVTLTLTAFTTIVLLYVALGYRFDRSSGHVVRSGLLLVDNKPQAGSIYINNQLKDNAAPGRFVLRAGEYDLKIARTGYRDWTKRIAVKASGVREASYPVLVPDVLLANTIKEFEKPSLISQSPDKKRLLTHVAGQPVMRLSTLKPDATEEVVLELPSSVRAESGNFGVIRVIEWSLNSRFVLLEQTLSGDTKEYISMDTAKPSGAVNISSLYGVEMPLDIHYVGEDTDRIYGISNGVLKRYSLKQNESEGLLQNVRSYQPYGSDTVLFDKQGDNQNNEVGILRDGVSTVVHTAVMDSGPSLLRLAEYENKQYFVIAPHNGSGVTVYRDPLKNPILAKQLPFAKIKFEGTQKIDFSNSAQFLLIQNENSEFVTYDFEDLRSYSGAFDFALDPELPVMWADSHHLAARRADGMQLLMDYDASNVQELVEASTRLYFSDNLETSYRFVEEGAAVQLQAVSLVLKD